MIDPGPAAANQPIKPRAPHGVRLLLRVALARLERGPVTPSIQGPDSEHRPGRLLEQTSQRGWRESWINEEIRGVLDYLDGKITARELAWRLGDPS